MSSDRLRHVCTLLFVLCTAVLMPAPASAQDARDAAAATAALKEGKNDLIAQRYEDAIKALKKANQLLHNSCNQCYTGMAVAQSRLGEYNDALKSCDKGISCATYDVSRAAGHVLKGNILEGMSADPKKLKAAESEYRAALQLEPTDPVIHFYLGVVLMRESQDADGITELNSYLNQIHTGTNADYARKIIVNPKRAGDPLAPEFSVQTLDGQQISLDQLAGKIVVMDFWATWCPPCRASVPELKALTKKYPSSQLALISFSADSDQQAWRNFISKNDMEWPQDWDSDGRIRNAFGVNAFPTYLVIDQEGFIRERIVGLNPQESVVHRLKDTLHAMLPQD